MSIMICLKTKSFKSFFKYFWTFSSVILSDYYSMRINGHFYRSFAGLWLLVCTLLLSLFSGALWDLLVRPPPMEKIESWNDLHTKPEWKNVEIYSAKYLDLYEFVNNDNSEMAQDFKRRAYFEDPFDLMFKRKFEPRNWDKIAKGEQVISADNLFAHWVKNFHKAKFKYLGLEDDTEFHISSLGSGMRPYFILTTPRFNDTMLYQLNKT